ncbi:unnamed protein product, partial [marine sediment metagenome]
YQSAGSTSQSEEEKGWHQYPFSAYSVSEDADKWGQNHAGDGEGDYQHANIRRGYV